MKTNDMYMPAEHMYQQPGQERHAVNAKPLSYLGKVIDPNLEDGEDGMPVAVYKMPPMEVNTALADARGGGGFSGMPKVQADLGGEGEMKKKKILKKKKKSPSKREQPEANALAQQEGDAYREMLTAADYSIQNRIQH